ncbi:PDR/VanB family oxidoreductase [Rhodococcus sp. NBC_00297]|uniref:PDR/VanB family oxidoreductase n=1 Tax=Rhodococcus sp. NBC_00297 TaxID=2976005 RepID=UPI002E2D1C40|nr:PDR/VanB family oxidoreductase [Rhodococcus sp. NBC_00297]
MFERLGSVAPAEPGMVLRGIGAASGLYALLAAHTKTDSTASLRRVGYDVDMVVDDAVDEADGVRSLLLRRSDGAPVHRWKAGAHVDLTTPSGATRQYSLAGSVPGGRHHRIAVRRVEGGSVSAEIHALPVGSHVRVRGPRNAFPLSAAPSYLFVAAGIGITPILSMIEATASLSTPWTLYYHGRARASMPFLAMLGELAAMSGGRLIIRSDDEDGLPDSEAIASLARPGTAMYVCGPAALTQIMRVRARALPDVEFHAELFSPPPVVDGEPFALTLMSTGEKIVVGPTETALDAVRRLRPEQAFSCRQGFCGACVVRYRSGEPRHLDRVLRPMEQSSSMALCVSRAARDTNLVLDL